MGKLSKNDAAWLRVFENTHLFHQIEQSGYAYISADELKSIGNREPRLMAKQDTLNARPAIFREHDLTIFPVENGRYIIFHDPEKKSYFRFDTLFDDIVQEQYTSKNDLYSFDSYPDNQRLSESQAIDFAFVSSLLHSFLGDECLFLTIRGRLRSGDFHFSLPNVKYQVDVSGVQIEVDSGYESQNKIYLIEAKVGKRDDFHIRQLFYPYLEWSQRSGKEIVPVFLIYSNGQYYLLQFQLNHVFGELTLVRKKCYTINESPRASINFPQLLQTVPVETEPPVPYPQADDLDKVVDIVHLIDEGMNSKIMISELFEFDERQGDYYLNAAAYLELIEKQEHCFELTPLGQRFSATKSRTERTSLLVTQMIKRPTFREALQLLLDNSRHLRLFDNYLSADDVTRKDIAGIIQKYTSLNEKTADRRALTVRSWMKWVLKNSEVVIS